ncbi:protein FAM241B-like [Apostichopus japonicus]|uniref:protein FAM241B-like n=1 Tax=Stichopus japonicus TaxID=307972 RepID=UPI003AB14F1A
MVRILANGDIVQDDDPRAQQGRRTQGGTNIHGLRSSTSDQGRGYRNEGQGQGGGQAWYGGGAGGEGVPEDGQVRQVSIFEVINQKLLDLGVPRWNFGQHVVEPIVLIGFLIAMLLFGFRGLLVGGLLFAVVKMSQGGGQNQQRRR